MVSNTIFNKWPYILYRTVIKMLREKFVLCNQRLLSDLPFDSLFLPPIATSFFMLPPALFLYS